MSELKPKIYDEANDIDYILVGDYYIPAIELPKDDDRPVGKWGRMHWVYLEEVNPLLLNHILAQIILKDFKHFVVCHLISLLKLVYS